MFVAAFFHNFFNIDSMFSWCRQAATPLAREHPTRARSGRLGGSGIERPGLDHAETNLLNFSGRFGRICLWSGAWREKLACQYEAPALSVKSYHFCVVASVLGRKRRDDFLGQRHVIICGSEL